MNRSIILIAVCLVGSACKNRTFAGEQSEANTILLEALDMSKYASLATIHPTPIDYGFKMNIATPRS